MGDVLFIEEEPNNQKANCNLCGKDENIVQMKGTGQYICGNACDESENEEEDQEDASETVEQEQASETVEETQEKETVVEVVEVEEVEVEEEEVEEEEVVEEEVEEEEDEEEEEEAVYEVEIKGKLYYTTDEKNGDVYEIADDEDIGDCIGKFVNGKFKKNK